MPRLLPRLARFLELESAGKIKYRQGRTKTREKPKKVAQAVDKRPPIVYKQNQNRSFLLDVNPIIEKGLYHVPKEPRPSLPSEQRVEGRSNGRRSMNEIELDATASPYVRMLSSPLRTCLFTRAMLPKDMMIRFGGALDPLTKSRYLLPNDIEHRKYCKQAGGKSFWVSCRREAVQHTVGTGMFAMAISDLKVHSKIIEQIECLMQRRLIQELELLRDRLQAAPHRVVNPDEPVIRALTLEELDAICLNNVGALAGGAAIISFKEPSDGTEISQIDECSTYPSRLVRDRTSYSSGRHVPLYDAFGLLSADTRQAVQTLLKEALRIETKAQDKIARKDGSTPSSRQLIPSDQDAPQAYLLRSTPQTLKRVDTVPVCIALWRFRLWGGQGWSDSLWGPWEERLLTPTP